MPVSKSALFGALAAAGALTATGAGAAPSGSALVVTKGQEIFDINGGAVATFRFEPEVLSVPSGSMVVFRHEDSGRDPHTITIVTKKSQLPHDFEGSNCKPCQVAQAGHFPNKKPPVAVLNAGRPGLDTAGDSLLIRPKRGAQASAVVSAPAGTTLYYVCIIHPWMQGTIKVT
jgi:plastocyanin